MEVCTRGIEEGYWASGVGGKEGEGVIGTEGFVGRMKCITTSHGKSMIMNVLWYRRIKTVVETTSCGKITRCPL